VAKPALDKAYGSRSFVTLVCPDCKREVDLYIASAPVVGAWCSCADKAMEITYERRWSGGGSRELELDVEVDVP
jgi:hypothetical protein